MPLTDPILLDDWLDAAEPEKLGGEWRWHFFSAVELRCLGTGRLLVVPDFLDRLSGLRTEYGKPMNVTSGYRAPEYNQLVSHTGSTGPHTTGRAVDVLVAGEDAVRLLVLANAWGFTGRGLRQHGPWDKRFMHLDDLPNAEGCPRPRVWTYR